MSQVYLHTLQKYNSLLSYIEKLRQNGKINSVTRSHWNAIVQRYHRLVASLKKIPIGMALSLLPCLSGSILHGQCNDVNLNPAYLRLSQSGTNALGINASPGFTDVDEDGLEDLVVAAWPGIEVYKRNNIGGYKLMYGDENNPFGKIQILQQSTITFYDFIIDDSGREEMFISMGGSGIKMYVYDAVDDEYKLSSDMENPFNFISTQFHSSPFIYTNFGSDVLQAVIIDNDGRVDFYSLNNEGKFVELSNVINLIDEEYRNPFLLDLDGNLFHEILVIGKSDGSLEYLEYNGAYVAAATNPFEDIMVDESADPVFDDLDGDGDLDLIVGDATGRINTYTNTNGVYSLNDLSKDPLYDVLASGERVKPLFHDWDCDGDEDIFLGTFNGLIEYIRNSGDDYVNAPEVNPFEGIDFGSNVYLALMDDGYDNFPIAIVGTEDGHLEMLSFNESIGKYEVIPGHSLGFVDVGSRATPSLVDYDLDGDEDLFVGSSGGDITYFKNLGNGNFELQEDSSNPFNDIFVGQGSSVVFLDANGDNVKDAFVSASQGIKYFNYTFSGFLRNDEDNPFRNLKSGPDIAKANIFSNGKYEVVLTQYSRRLLTFSNWTSSNSTCYNLEDCLINSWVGGAINGWNDSPHNWSLRRIPPNCDAVVVPANHELIIASTTAEQCAGLSVLESGELEINGQLTVIRPD